MEETIRMMITMEIMAVVTREELKMMIDLLTVLTIEAMAARATVYTVPKSAKNVMGVIQSDDGEAREIGEKNESCK